MSGQWLQFVASGLTAGAIYALVALGFFFDLGSYSTGGREGVRRRSA